MTIADSHLLQNVNGLRADRVGVIGGDPRDKRNVNCTGRARRELHHKIGSHILPRPSRAKRLAQFHRSYAHKSSAASSLACTRSSATSTASVICVVLA